MQMLSSARHLRLTPALLVEFATNEANARTETVDRIACLERENSKLREGLASALALNDIGIRIESLKYKPEGRVVQVSKVVKVSWKLFRLGQTTELRFQ